MKQTFAFLNTMRRVVWAGRSHTVIAVQDGVNADPKQLSQSLRAIPGKPLHFEVMGNAPLIYQPYWELQDEPFTCFPRIQKIK
jgi:hypothetical protein